MKKMYDDKRLMIKVCDLYYNSDIKQEIIAKKLGISRATISRILKSAKEEGIVRIEVINPYANQFPSLEKQLEEKYSLTEVIIVDDTSESEKQRNLLGQACAKYLQRVLTDKDIVGLSMGRTLKAISKYIKSEKQSNMTFVPLLGGMGQLGIEIHCNQIVIDLAKAFGGTYNLLHAPAMVSDRKLIDDLRQDFHIKQVLDLMNEMTTAVVGIGTAVPGSTMMETGYYNDQDIKEMKKLGIIGDICLQMYDSNGNDDYNFNNYIFGVQLEKLKNVDKVVGVSGGVEKVDAIRGAINGGFIDVLITNYSNAKTLLKDK